jgi:hypothetical protein
MSLYDWFLVFVAIVALLLTAMAVVESLETGDAELQAHVDQALTLGNSGRQS